MGQFGQELRREREVRGVTIDEICALTKVSSRHVEALEAERYGELPGGIFRKGILRSYVTAVGLEEAVWVARFEASLRESGAAGPAEQEWTEFAENVGKNRKTTEPPTGLRWVGVLLMVLVLLLCGWLTWKLVLHGRLDATSAAATTAKGASSLYMSSPHTSRSFWHLS